MFSFFKCCTKKKERRSSVHHRTWTEFIKEKVKKNQVLPDPDTFEQQLNKEKEKQILRP